ncbi:MAG: polysaccharide deacetylase family protein [Saprospiraceae bacterium]|nr:polysaccharide deacetylase family protein [Saprospiraceae bacterium]MDW8484508.1 polysaccharide deacetylase family protein [Saprospiraceae bacterium]
MQVTSPPVLYFHSVAPRPFAGWPLRFLTMRLDRFEQQMHYLHKRGYRAIFLEEWLAMRRGELPTDEKAVCLTFDDGLLDNWVYAFPIAKKYGMRMTLFVCPELIEPGDHVRPNLEDVWAGRCHPSALKGLGQLSWGELRKMQESGYADIQSHTMSHTKYIVSDRLCGFYYGGFAGFYTTLNTYSLCEKPFYSQDKDFEYRLPWGMPLFEEKSAVIARKKIISPAFYEEILGLAEKFDLTIPEHRPIFERKARQLYRSWQTTQKLVIGEETEAEYNNRLVYEITQSRQVLEAHLRKPVRFLCWPHGDNSPSTHLFALESGYAATTAGKLVTERGRLDRIHRLGTDWGNIHLWWMYLKLDYKLGSHYGQQPYYAIWWLNEWKNRLLMRN